MTKAVELAQVASNGVSEAFKNRIINGQMVIDQRNAGASVTPTDGAYTLDRWNAGLTQASKFTVQQSTTAATGFINSLLVTSSSAYSVGASDLFRISQYVEGLNVSDLAWGTANAATVTLSFWVRSSLTGTFSGSLMNSAASRSYPFTYAINSANTFEYKTVTIAGDTTGTWLTTNGIGIRVGFSLGAGSSFSATAGTWATGTYTAATGATSVVGTNGATFYITGVQLEVGSTATSFDYRPYGTELALCQRYFERSYDIGNANGSFTNGWRGVTTTPNTITEALGWSFAVTKRTSPTIVTYNAISGALNGAYQVSTATNFTSSVRYAGTTGIGIIDIGGGASQANTYYIHYTASAEL